MSKPSWDQIQDLFTELRELAPAERESRLASVAQRDPELHAEVASLLAADAEVDGPLDAPPTFKVSSLEAGVWTTPFGAGTRIGPYQLVRLLGEGGMGSVWLAERADGKLHRSVALKLPKWTWTVGNLTARLARERDILASLEHANIARLYDAGVDDLGRPYLAMEYVAGEAIDRFCASRNLNIAQRLQLVVDVARAVSYAHSRLVVHRDLKPSNILVADDGSIRLLDFGVARLLQSDEADSLPFTQAGVRAFTLEFAAPEQLRGESVGTATDVYALGCVLYVLLTSASPYRVELKSAGALEAAILAGDTRLASDACSDAATAQQLRGDLDAILVKALQLEPLERYASVDALADDINRFLRHEPVRARPARFLYRAHKFARRHRLALSTGAAIAIALIGAALFSMHQAQRAQLEAKKATAIKNFLVGIFAAADAVEPHRAEPQEMRVIDVMDQGRTRLLTELNDLPEAKLELVDVIGDIYELLDSTDRALGLYESALPIASQVYGSDSAQYARLLALIASAQMLAGDFEAAEGAIATAEAAFAARRDSQSLEYANLLKIKGNLLRSKGTAGNRAAIDVLANAARLFASRYPTDRGHSGAYLYLAQAHVALGEPALALAAADGAVAAAMLRPEDTVTRASAHSLRASVLDRDGDFDRALDDYDAASSAYKRALGERHFLYLQNENLRAAALQVVGRYVDALPVLRATTQVIGEVRPNSNTHVNALRRLAAAQLRDGDARGALATLDTAIELATNKQVAGLQGALLMQAARAHLDLDDHRAAEAAIVSATSTLEAGSAMTDAIRADLKLLSAEVALAKRDESAARAALAAALQLSAGSAYADKMRRVSAHLVSTQLAAKQAQADAELQRAQSLVDELPASARRFPQLAILEQRTAYACRFGGRLELQQALAREREWRSQLQSHATQKSRRASC
jgi:serine/threonine-protein kinase